MTNPMICFRFKCLHNGIIAYGLSPQQSQVLSTRSKTKLPWNYKPLFLRKIRQRQSKDPSYLRPLFEYQEKKKKEALEKSSADYVEPPPSPLHYVRLEKTLYNRPYYEKIALGKIGLDKKHSETVLKNTPRNNEMLRSLKHMLTIKPLTFPHGMPTDPSDVEHSLLKQTGEFIVKKKLPAVEQIESASNLENPRKDWEMKHKTVQAHLWRRYLAMKTFSEYHPTKYKYNLNQDGKEYRYNKYSYKKASDGDNDDKIAST